MATLPFSVACLPPTARPGEMPATKFDNLKLPPQFAWARHAPQLAAWWFARANRTDVWGGYLPREFRKDGKKTVTKPAIEKRGQARHTLTLDVLEGHFRGADEGCVIGLHTTSADGTCQFVVVDIDAHEGDNADPQANRRFAIHLNQKAKSLGFTPLLEDSNGAGGYHLWIFFNKRIPAIIAYAFARWLTSDHAEHGLSKPPECFPKSPNSDQAFGAWVRLPGRHHSSNHVSRIFNGTDFCLGDVAVRINLSIEGDDPALIPAEASPAVAVPAPAPLPPSPESIAHIDMADRMKRCFAYLNGMPNSIAGQGGHDAFFAAARACQWFGLDRERARLALRHFNRHKCHPEWSAAELEHKLDDAERIFASEFGSKLVNESHVVTVEERAKLPSDLGNAARYALRHRGDIRFVYAFSKFYVFNGKCWEIDDTGRAIEFAKQTALVIGDEARVEPDDKRREMLYSWAATTQKRERLSAMVELAKPDIALSSDALDADPMLFNCANGTLNLCTGELRPHRREDLLTRISPVAYDPDAACPTFVSFLHRTFQGDERLIAFMQRVIGYTLTGVTSERCAFFLWGGGANGKSTLLAILKELMGQYAAEIRADALTMKRGDAGIPNDIARLKGARFVRAVEFDEGRRLAEATLKSMTGGEDVISARFMRGEWFDFKPAFKLFVGTNHKVEILGTDDAIWDRIKLVPFHVRFYKSAEEAERECGDATRVQDRELIGKLKAELPGILAWAVEGCLAWQRDGGLGTPEIVSDAVRTYRMESDALAEFLSDCTVDDSTAMVGATALYETYVQYCRNNGTEMLNQTRFGKAIRERGYVSVKSGTKNWHGLRLKPAGTSSAGNIHFG